MATTQVYRRQLLPSINTGMAPRSTNAAITNEEEVWKEVQRLGKFLSNAGERIHEAKTADEIIKANSELEQVLNKSTEDQLGKENPLDRTKSPATTTQKDETRGGQPVSLGHQLSSFGSFA